MLQDIGPHIYHNEMAFQPPEPGALGLVYGQEGVLARVMDGALELPRVEELGPAPWIYAFSVDETPYYLTTGAPQARDFSFTAYRDLAPRHQVFACAVGQSLYRWYVSNRYCGACGGKLEPGTRERSLVCPRCGHTIYPKICPAVIVAVCDGGRLLLTRYAGRAFKRYALVAGFCEIGETVEQTVAREVLEETGLRVRNLRFYKSQPWVITDSLLMGFFVDLVGSGEIRLQEDELSEGRWFSREQLPTNHSFDSLTGEMIEMFRLGREPR